MKTPRLAPLAFISLLAMLLVGCGPSFKNLHEISKSSVLLLPARDAVQNGTWHEHEAGKSGTRLTDNLRDDLKKNGWEVMQTADPAFTNREIPTVAQQLAEADKLGARYVLHVVLGEFLDAAPMTFRPDFLTIQAATMYDSKSRELVWQLSAPKVYDGTNLGVFWRFIPSISHDIASSIVP